MSNELSPLQLARADRFEQALKHLVRMVLDRDITDGGKVPEGITETVLEMLQPVFGSQTEFALELVSLMIQLTLTEALGWEYK